MTDAPSTLPKPVQFSGPVPQELLERALESMRAVLRGNGVAPQDIALKSFDGGILEFEAKATFSVATAVKEKTVNGRESGRVFTNEGEMRQEIQRAGESAAQDPAVQKAVREALRLRPDRGFGIDGETIELPSLATQFVVPIDCATCRGKKTMPCTGCKGTSRISCTKCRGQRDMTCPACRGSRMQNNNTQTCAQCQGRGRVGCTACRQTGQVPCPRCRGSGRMPCQTCGGAGARSIVAALSFRAEGHFSIDLSLLPEGLPQQLDRLRGTLVSGKHAEATIMSAGHDNEAPEKSSGPLVIPYHVRMPFGQIVFTVKKKDIAGTLCGFTALVDTPPFLEKIAGRGLKMLAEASTSKGSISGPLAEASRYRLIHDVLALSAGHKPRRAAELLKQHYPIGIRDFLLPQMVKQARICLKNLTRLPRIIGFAIGMALCAGLDLGWFIGPLRAMVIAHNGPMAGLAGDALLPIIGILFCMFAIQISSAHAINRVLGRQKKAGARKGMPKAVGNMMYDVTGSLLAFAGSLYAASMQGRAPSWLALLLHITHMR